MSSLSIPLEKLGLGSSIIDPMRISSVFSLKAAMEYGMGMRWSSLAHVFKLGKSNSLLGSVSLRSSGPVVSRVGLERMASASRLNVLARVEEVS